MTTTKKSVQEVYRDKLWETSVVRFGAMIVRNIVMDESGTYSVEGDSTRFTESPGEFELTVEESQ